MPSDHLTTILRHLPATPDEGELLDGFTAYAVERGLELYPAQEEAVLELLSGSNVILSTPTGSGKSLVAVAAHFAALARRRTQRLHGADQGARVARSSSSCAARSVPTSSA